MRFVYTVLLCIVLLAQDFRFRGSFVDPDAIYLGWYSAIASAAALLLCDTAPARGWLTRQCWRQVAWAIYGFYLVANATLFFLSPTVTKKTAEYATTALALTAPAFALFLWSLPDVYFRGIHLIAAVMTNSMFQTAFIMAELLTAAGTNSLIVRVCAAALVGFQVFILPLKVIGRGGAIRGRADSAQQNRAFFFLHNYAVVLPLLLICLMTKGFHYFTVGVAVQFAALHVRDNREN